MLYPFRSEILASVNWRKVAAFVEENLGSQATTPSCTEDSPICTVQGNKPDIPAQQGDQQTAFTIPRAVQQPNVGTSTGSTAGTTTVANRGGWQGASFPVENFQGYSSGFGYRPSPTNASGWELHRGLDLAAPEGSYVRSWWAGQVIQVADDPLCGIMVRIQSGDWQHVYCHMQGKVETAENGRYLIDRNGGILIWQGQQVASGTRIGRVGMTGRTTGPHLHWGLKYSNNYVDPGLVLRAMYQQQQVRGQ